MLVKESNIIHLSYFQKTFGMNRYYIHVYSVPLLVDFVVVLCPDVPEHVYIFSAMK